MRNLLSKSLVAAGSCLFAAGLFAQERPYQGENRDRDYRHEMRDRDRGGAGLVNRVLGDLDRTQSWHHMNNGSRKHVERARRDLIRFEQRWNEGRFDRGRLDGAIANINHLVNSGRIGPRDRDLLSRDLYDLREFRASRGRFGGPRNGYR